MKGILNRVAIALIALAPILAWADSNYRHHVMNVSMASAVSDLEPKLVWPASLSMTSDVTSFDTAGGDYILPSPKNVASAYDSEIRHDVSSFYRTKKDRINMILGFTLWGPGTVISVGYDSGVKAEKLSIKRALFLGVNHTVRLRKNTYLGFGLGKWIGGRISETPCVDTYDREYWCQNLTAWSEYVPSYPKVYQYAGFRFLKTFD